MDIRTVEDLPPQGEFLEAESGPPRGKRHRSTILLKDDQGRILLVKGKGDPFWGLPGGGVDPGEVAGVAAAREVGEETGYQVGDTTPVFDYSTPTTYHTVFEANVLNPEIQAQLQAKEIEDLRWWSPGEDLLVLPSNRHIIEQHTGNRPNAPSGMLDQVVPWAATQDWRQRTNPTGEIEVVVPVGHDLPPVDQLLRIQGTDAYFAVPEGAPPITRAQVARGIVRHLGARLGLVEASGLHARFGQDLPLVADGPVQVQMETAAGMKYTLRLRSGQPIPPNSKVVSGRVKADIESVTRLLDSSARIDESGRVDGEGRVELEGRVDGPDRLRPASQTGLAGRLDGPGRLNEPGRMDESGRMEGEGRADLERPDRLTTTGEAADLIRVETSVMGEGPGRVEGPGQPVDPLRVETSVTGEGPGRVEGPGQPVDPFQLTTPINPDIPEVEDPLRLDPPPTTTTPPGTPPPTGGPGRPERPELVELNRTPERGDPSTIEQVRKGQQRLKTDNFPLEEVSAPEGTYPLEVQYEQLVEVTYNLDTGEERVEALSEPTPLQIIQVDLTPPVEQPRFAGNVRVTPTGNKLKAQGVTTRRRKSRPQRHPFLRGREARR